MPSLRFGIEDGDCALEPAGQGLTFTGGMALLLNFVPNTGDTRAAIVADFTKDCGTSNIHTDIHSVASNENIAPVVSKQKVISVVAKDRVVAVTSTDGVVTPVAMDRVIAT